MKTETRVVSDMDRGMKRPYLKIWTPYGESYNVNILGQIQRLDMEFTPSDGWKMIGLQHVAKNIFVPLSELLAGEFPASLLYKNGHPQWTVRDLDHGTTRVWGNTTRHGVSRIYLMEEGA